MVLMMMVTTLLRGPFLLVLFDRLLSVVSCLSVRPACPCSRYLVLLSVFYDGDDVNDGYDGAGDDVSSDDDDDDGGGSARMRPCDARTWAFLLLRLVRVLVICCHYQ